MLPAPLLDHVEDYFGQLRIELEDEAESQFRFGENGYIVLFGASDNVRDLGKVGLPPPPERGGLLGSCAGGKMLTADELILQKLKDTFNRNENVATNSNGTNVWVMLLAAEPLCDLLAKNLPYPLTDQNPTQRVRVVLSFLSLLRVSPKKLAATYDTVLGIIAQAKNLEYLQFPASESH